MTIPHIHSYLDDWSDEIEYLRQNWLMNESRFLSFARDRGIAVHGLIEGEPGKFYKDGLLRADGLDEDGAPYFHPFIYPLHELLRVTRHSAEADRERIAATAHKANTIADLAIILEPLYWPRIRGSISLPLGGGLADRNARIESYASKALTLVRTLPVDDWQTLHAELRTDAAHLDKNTHLYVLLRLSRWGRREELQGRVSAALWIRHIAEVTRRGFEEAFQVNWLEEDQGLGFWPPGSRERVFGAERPFDREIRTRPYIAGEFGLYTGSAVRWYVEGDTEYYAIHEMISQTFGEPEVFGIELYNLQGTFISLPQSLSHDRAHRRFSMISFDADVAANEKLVRRQAERDNIVGSVAPQHPDFEFANFTRDELIDIVVSLDEAQGFTDSDTIRGADRSGLNSGKDLQKWYGSYPGRRASLVKGEKWGRALAKYAQEHPTRPDETRERRINQDVRTALMARTSDYDVTRANFRVDPKTFELVRR